MKRIQTKIEQNRRYKLHQRIKQFAQYKRNSRVVYVPTQKAPTAREAKALNELKDKFNYSIQTEII